MIYEKREATFAEPDFKETFKLETADGRDNIVEQLNKDIEAYCQVAYTDAEPRSHLGASVIGEECERKIWFAFRWMGFEKFKGQMLRLFYRGHREEDALIEILRGIGCDVKQIGEDGKQLSIEKECNGHFGGSSDSVFFLPIRYGQFNERILVEYKTANDKSFEKVNGPGIEKAKREHWSQVCIYGYKHKIEYALYIMVNKNDDRLWIEIVKLDWGLAEGLINKAETIINSYYPPPRLSHDPSFWKCRFCTFNGICHLNHPVERNCRSCQFAQPVEDGQWKCHKWNAIIPKEAIIKGCNAWESLPR